MGFEEPRFSLMAYSNQQRRQGQNQHALNHLHEFTRLVDELRGELSSPQGKYEKEKQEYNETLNKAILGFSEERAQFLAIINDYLAKRHIPNIPPADSRHSSLGEALFAEVIGLNVLELLLKNRENLEEIQVVGARIYEVRNGLSIPSPYQFSTFHAVERIQQNLVLFNHDTINPRKKWAEVMLKDGSRVTLTGFGFTALPTITIRFYTVHLFRLETLCRPHYETINDKILAIIRVLINSYFNLVIIGSTNSGKSHFIKSCIAEMPDDERIITIETRFELMLGKDFPHKNIVEYEIDEQNPVHDGNQAFKLALRQSPKRICLAEIRDDDANLYVRACTRGHEGSITTVHVNELEDAPDAITDMCMLDRRGMDSGRMLKRITEYVTQIGLEMAIVNGKRKVVRIGAFEFIAEQVVVHDIVRYDFNRSEWVFPGDWTKHSLARIHRFDPAGYEHLLELGVIRL